MPFFSIQTERYFQQIRVNEVRNLSSEEKNAGVILHMCICIIHMAALWSLCI